MRFVLFMIGISLVHDAAADGTVFFSGRIVEPTCDVSVNTLAGFATVALPKVSADGLQIPATTAGNANFDLSLSDCKSGIQAASVLFESSLSAGLDTARPLTNRTDANNVSLQLRNGFELKNDVKLGNSQQLTRNSIVDLAKGHAVLPYVVEYQIDGKATQGAVTSLVTYTIEYL